MGSAGSPELPELPQAASVSDNISAIPNGAKVVLYFIERWFIDMLPNLKCDLRHIHECVLEKVPSRRSTLSSFFLDDLLPPKDESPN